jgi:hypothetical protein
MHACPYIHTHTQAYASDPTAFNITCILHTDAPARSHTHNHTQTQAYASDPTTFNVAGLSDALTQLQVECVLYIECVLSAEGSLMLSHSSRHTHTYTHKHTHTHAHTRTHTHTHTHTHIHTHTHSHTHSHTHTHPAPHRCTYLRLLDIQWHHLFSSFSCFIFPFQILRELDITPDRRTGLLFTEIYLF